MLDSCQRSTPPESAINKEPTQKRQAIANSASDKKKSKEDETIRAIQALTQLKNSASFQSTLGRAQFVVTAFENRIYQELQTDPSLKNVGISSYDIQECISGVDRDVVIHIVVGEALQRPKVRASIMSSRKGLWESWCDIFDAIERARAVDRYQGMKHMCSRFEDLYSDACEKMKMCFNPRWELPSAEYYLTPLEYRELLCLSSLLLNDEAPYGPVELGRRAFAGNINNPGMDTDLIFWIKTFSKNSSPRKAIDKWKAGWSLAKNLEHLEDNQPSELRPAY